jgi:hypothetical protein
MTSVNHEFNPSLYSSSTIPPKMKGGSRLGFKDLSSSTQITGKSAGHPEHHSYVPTAQPRDLHHDFKNPFPTHTGGKRRRMKAKSKTRRSHTHKGGRKSHKTHKTRKSHKVHKGGDRIKELWDELIRLRSKKGGRGNRSGHRSRSRRMRGGSVRGENSLPMNNEPLTWGYQLNTRIPPEMSALANPMPIQSYVKGEPVARS